MGSMFDEKNYWVVYMVMEQLGMKELCLPESLVITLDSPSMTVTYDTDTKQYIFKLKEKDYDL